MASKKYPVSRPVIAVPAFEIVADVEMNDEVSAEVPMFKVSTNELAQVIENMLDNESVLTPIVNRWFEHHVGFPVEFYVRPCFVAEGDARVILSTEEDVIELAKKDFEDDGMNFSNVGLDEDE